MRLQTKLVAVRKIHSTVPCSDFPEAEIEAAAQAILQGQGTINPLILQQLDWQSYQVVSDHFSYYAAVRARELDLAAGEMIQAIILEPENEGAILEQIKLFRNSARVEPTPSPQPQPDLDPGMATRSSPVNPESFAAMLDRLERNLIAQMRSPQGMMESLEQKLIAKIEGMAQQQARWQGEMMAVLQSLQAPHPVPSSSHGTDPLPITPSKINLNTATITDLCQVKGLGKQKAQAIIARRKAQGPFTHLEELVEIAGITPNTVRKYDFAQYLTVA